jgi:hypothetical protein
MSPTVFEFDKMSELELEQYFTNHPDHPAASSRNAATAYQSPYTPSWNWNQVRDLPSRARAYETPSFSMGSGSSAFSSLGTQPPSTFLPRPYETSSSSTDSGSSSWYCLGAQSPSTFTPLPAFGHQTTSLPPVVSPLTMSLESNLKHRVSGRFPSLRPDPRPRITIGMPSSHEYRGNLSFLNPTVSDFQPLRKPKGPKFTKFLALPQEIRSTIYELALYTGQPILPHLCDSSIDEVKFHDDGSYTPNMSFSGHNSISRLLGMTKVSKAIRAEALPCFYSTNTFQVVHDTPVYFTHLEMINRFHLIRHVQFRIQQHFPNHGAMVLSSLAKHLEAAATHPAYSGSNPGTWLRNSPEYFDSCTELSQFIVMRKLASAFTGPDAANGAVHTQTFAFPVPRASIFSHEYPHLTWFATVAHGMGTHLHYVEGHPLAFSGRHLVDVKWSQQFQKKDFDDAATAADKVVDVKARAIELYPRLTKEKSFGVCYMRIPCHGDGIFWRKTAGDWQPGDEFRNGYRKTEN